MLRELKDAHESRQGRETRIRVLLDIGQHPHSLEHVWRTNFQTFKAGGWRSFNVFLESAMYACLSGILWFQPGPTNISCCIHHLYPLFIFMWPESRNREMGELNSRRFRSEEELSDNIAWCAKKFIETEKKMICVKHWVCSCYRNISSSILGPLSPP